MTAVNRVCVREFKPTRKIGSVQQSAQKYRAPDYKLLELSESAVAVSGLDLLTGVRDGSTFSATGRVTFVVAKRRAVWQIVQFHRSPVAN
jgi:Calcium/calmodulin dependent protein kinase II association domain